jgi:Flp pilus assembly protein TadD
VSPAPARGGKAFLAAALLSVLVLFVYAQTAGFDFIFYDDRDYIVENPAVRDGLSTAGARWALTAFRSSNWHPLTWLSLMADVSLFGPRPGPMHLVNVLLHALTTVTLFLVLLAMTGAFAASFLTAALFAVHPLHVESVAWIVERKDVLSGFLFALFLAAWLGYLRRPGAGRYLLAAACLVLGLSAKPMLVSAPLVILILDGWPLGRLRPGPDGRFGWRRPLLEKAPLVLPVAAVSAVTWLVQSRSGALAPWEDLPLSQRLANAVVSVEAYLSKTVWPAGLIVFYPHPRATLGGWRVAGAVALLAGLTALAWRWRRSRPWLAAGWLAWLVMLLPVIGLVQVGSQGMADRYTYLPLVGLFLAVSWSLVEGLDTPRRRWAAAGAATAVIVALTTTARFQTAHWRSTLALFSHAAAVQPDNRVARWYHASALLDAGRVQEGLAEYGLVMEWWPDDPSILHDYGRFIMERGREEEARTVFERIVRLEPGHAMARFRLGLLAARRGDLPEAEAFFREVTRLDPGYAPAHLNLAVALREQGRPDEARAEFDRAESLQPGVASGGSGGEP